MHSAWLLLAVSIVLLSYVCLRDGRNRRLPPGPPTLPLIGNLHQLPSLESQRDTFRRWHQKYGPIVSLKVGPKVIILLGNHEVTRDLLDKRGGLYSDRPRMVMADECVCKGMNTLLLSYDSTWKTHKRLLTALLNPRAVERYHEVLDMESKQFLHEMLTTNDFTGRFKRYAASTLFSLAYTKRLTTGHEPEIQEITAIIDHLEETIGATWLVDILPFLNHLPPYLAPWKRNGDRFYERTTRLFNSSANDALQQSSWNWSKQIRELPEAKNVPPEELSYVVGILFEAGLATSQGIFDVFVLASMLHPAVVRQAQAELDEVVGSRRLPTLSDFPRLPFVSAFVSEVMRWRPVLPSGIPHAAGVEDSYNGYHIPRGSIVIPNDWSIHLDENTYDDATSFHPQRWIDNPDLPLAVFGYGRRVCPGKPLAIASLKLAISRFLWAFDFDHAYDNGKRVEIDSWNLKIRGIFLKPEPFQASFRARDESRKNVIENEWAESEREAEGILNRLSSAFLKD